MANYWSFGCEHLSYQGYLFCCATCDPDVTYCLFNSKSGWGNHCEKDEHGLDTWTEKHLLDFWFGVRSWIRVWLFLAPLFLIAAFNQNCKTHHAS